MSEEDVINRDLGKLEIKQLRKERKLLKKTAKQEKRQKDNERKHLELKLGPRDQHVTIISRDIADDINESNKIPVYNNTNSVFDNKDDNFPALSSTRTKSNVKQIKTVLSDASCSKQNKNTITVNLIEILNKPKSNVTQKQTSKIEKYNGNILDASKPKRCRGKHREICKPKPVSKLKSQIIADLKQHDNNVVNYCDNLINDELNTVAREFLNRIVRYQENLYKRDPIKGTVKRRYVTGFREVRKFILVNKIKLLIIAPNIKNIVENGTLDIVIQELISLANENNVPHVFALSRRRIGQITLKNIPINCVGIFYYDGAEQLFNEILKLLESLKIPILSEIKEVTEEIKMQ